MALKGVYFVVGDFYFGLEVVMEREKLILNLTELLGQFQIGGTNLGYSLLVERAVSAT